MSKEVRAVVVAVLVGLCVASAGAQQWIALARRRKQGEPGNLRIMTGPPSRRARAGAGRWGMQVGARADPWWAALTAWGVVNAVNVLQAAGFLSRVWTGGRAINHALGYAIAGLAVPAAAALVAFVRAGRLAAHGGAGCLPDLCPVDAGGRVPLASGVRVAGAAGHPGAVPRARFRGDPLDGLLMFRMDRTMQTAGCGW
jgi:hypothetical protein